MKQQFDYQELVRFKPIFEEISQKSPQNRDRAKQLLKMIAMLEYEQQSAQTNKSIRENMAYWQHQNSTQHWTEITAWLAENKPEILAQYQQQSDALYAQYTKKNGIKTFQGPKPKMPQKEQKQADYGGFIFFLCVILLALWVIL